MDLAPPLSILTTRIPINLNRATLAMSEKSAINHKIRIPKNVRHNFLCHRLQCQASGEVEPMIVGIDHGFSFPWSYFSQHQLKT